MKRSLRKYRRLLLFLFRLQLDLLVCLAICQQAYTQTRVTSASAAANESHADALSKAGKHWAAELREQEARLDASFKRLNQAIELMKVEELSGTRLAIIEVRAIVRNLREQVDRVLADHYDLLNTSKAYRESLEKIRPLLLTAAGTFAEYASEEPFEELQKDYRMWAEFFVAIAEKYDQKRVRVQPAVQAVADNLAYVKRTALLLERLERLLEIPPDDGPDTEVFLQRVASYVQSFEELRLKLRELHGAVRGRPSPQVKPQAAEEQSADRDKTAAYEFPAEPPHRPAPIKAHFVSHPSSTSRPAANEYAFEVLIDEQFVDPQDIVREAATQSNEPSYGSSSDKATEGLPTRSDDGYRKQESPRERRESEQKEREKEEERQKMEQRRREMAQRRIPPHPDILPYFGTWKVSPGTVTIQLSRGGGDRAIASLVRSPAILAASGEFRLDGKELVATDYRYHLATGAVLDLSGTRFRLAGQGRLAAEGPKYIRNGSRGFERLYGRSFRYTLTRTGDAIPHFLRPDFLASEVNF